MYCFDFLWPTIVLMYSQVDLPPETLIETLSILGVLITNFPGYVSQLPLQPPPIRVLTPLLTHPRPAVRKRAIASLALFVPTSALDVFSGLLTSDVMPNLAPSANIDKQMTTIQLVAAIARSSPQRFAPSLPAVAPGLLKAVQRDDDDLRDATLQARPLLRAMKSPY